MVMRGLKHFTFGYFAVILSSNYAYCGRPCNKSFDTSLNMHLYTLCIFFCQTPLCWMIYMKFTYYALHYDHCISVCFDILYIEKVAEINWIELLKLCVRHRSTHTTVKPRPEAHMDMILFEVFLKTIDLIPQQQILQRHYLYYRQCHCTIWSCGIRWIFFKNASKRIMSISSSGRGFTVCERAKMIRQYFCLWQNY